MMKHSLCIAAALVLAGAGAPIATFAQPPDRLVYVEAQGRGSGHGITRRSGDACFVVAPDHVVRGDTVLNPSFHAPPDTIWIVAQGNRRIPATFERSVGLDLAILRVLRTSPYAATLCARWPRIRSTAELEAQLNSKGQRAEGELVSREAGGTESRLRVVVRRVDAAGGRFMVVTERGDDRVKRGMSGSLVTVNGSPAGMLVEVASDTTEAVVLGLDAMEDVIRRYFHDNVPPAQWKTTLSLAVPGAGQLATRRPGLAVLWFGTSVAFSGLALRYPKTVTRTEVVDDDFGIPRSYPYKAREHPYKLYALGWFLSGAASALEARRYARRYPHVRDEPAVPRRTSVRVAPSAATVGGEPAAALEVRVSF